MIRSFTKVARIAFLILVLLTSACQQSTIIATLEGVVSAAEIAIPVIGAATGLNPATSAAIVSYLQQVNIATAQAATILAGTGSSAQKAAQIVQLFAGIAAGCNCIPPGTPQQVVAVVNLVVQAVVNFLANFHPVGVASTAPVKIKITAGDRTKLASIRTRSEKNLANLKGVKK
jgi:hypothetical protein